MTVLWLILFIIMVIIEALTQGLTTIWFAAGALVALIISIFVPNVLVQTFAFVAVSVVLLVFTRPLLAGYFNRKVTPTNVDSLLGNRFSYLFGTCTLLKIEIYKVNVIA